MNLYSLLESSACRYPSHGAVYIGARQVLDYTALHARARAIGAALRAETRPGDRIAIVSANCPQYFEILFGAWAAGLVVTPINYKLHPREVGQILEDATPKIVMTSPELHPDVSKINAPGIGRVIEIGSQAYEALASKPGAPPFDVAPDALAWLFYTSGTTGRSKGAMLSHRNLMAMTLAFFADVDWVEPDHSLLHGAPLSHGSGLYALPYIARGARHVIPESGGFDPAEQFDLCGQHPACSTFMAPTMVQRFRLEAERRGTRPANLRGVFYGGGPMYVDDLKRSLATFGQVFIQLYGQGESPMTITSLRRDEHRSSDDAVLGSVGWARAGVEVRLVDPDDRPVSPGESGEVVCRGDVVMQGYWQNPAATASTLKGGWLHTGDMGVMDASGMLTLQGRSKELIISGGSNIYPREVEEALTAHPDVLECAVIGEPDPEWGENVVAFIVRRDGTTISASDLDRHCLDRIARFKRPKSYVFVEALPKNNYGKVVKRELSSLRQPR